jgi:hypothetical protein
VNKLEKISKEVVKAFFEVPSLHLAGATEETMKDIGQDSQFSGLQLNLGPPKYEAGVTTTQPLRSVF